MNMAWKGEKIFQKVNNFNSPLAYFEMPLIIHISIPPLCTNCNLYFFQTILT